MIRACNITQEKDILIGARTRIPMFRLAFTLFAIASTSGAIAGPPFPDGDECDQCIPAVEGLYFGTTLDNSGDVDDTACTPGDIVDEWYCITPSQSGIARASLCLSEFDTALAVFNDCNGAMVACNDDLCGIAGLPHWQAFLTWGVVADHTYYVRVSGYMNDQGNYVLDLNPHIGPIDATLCGACFEISDGVTEIETELLESRWYCYTATCAGRVTASACTPATTDPVLAVYDECGGAIIDQNDDACGFMNWGSIIQWYVEPGERYPIEVRGLGDPGRLDLLIECEPCLDSPNGDFNDDGIADSGDLQGFVGAIENQSNDDASRCAGDFDHSGTVDGGDIPPMVTLLISDE